MAGEYQFSLIEVTKQVGTKTMSIKSMMPLNHLILCCTLLRLP